MNPWLFFNKFQLFKIAGCLKGEEDERLGEPAFMLSESGGEIVFTLKVILDLTTTPMNKLNRRAKN